MTENYIVCCNYCGYYFNGRTKDCPECGEPIPDAQFRQYKDKPEFTSTPGTAVDISEIVDIEAYEQAIMDKLGITKENMESVGRAIVQGNLVGTVLGEMNVNTALDIRRGLQALELWQEWFKDGGDPGHVWEISGDPHCFFCEAWLGYEEHELNCIYTRAKKLIEGD